MHTIRLSLVGMVNLAAGLTSAAAIARWEEPSGPLDWTRSTMFSGTSTCTVVGFGQRTGEDIIHQRGFTSERTRRMSDPV